MYTFVTLAAGLGALYLQNRWLQVLGFLAIVSTLVFLPPSRSLVGGVAITAILIVAISVYAVRRWSRRGLMVANAAGVIIVAGVLMTPSATNFRAELAYRVSGDSIFSGRDTILNLALAVWDRHTILGTGWFSFGPASSEEVVRAALEADGLAGC